MMNWSPSLTIIQLLPGVSLIVDKKLFPFASIDGNTTVAGVSGQCYADLNLTGRFRVDALSGLEKHNITLRHRYSDYGLITGTPENQTPKDSEQQVEQNTNSAN